MHRIFINLEIINDYVVNIREKGIYNNVTVCIMITDVKHTGGTVTKFSIIGLHESKNLYYFPLVVENFISDKYSWWMLLQMIWAEKIAGLN